jgi:hypothetical protein
MVTGGAAALFCGLASLWFVHGNASVVNGSLVIASDVARWVFVAIPGGIMMTTVGALLLLVGLWSNWQEKLTRSASSSETKSVANANPDQRRPGNPLERATKLWRWRDQQGRAQTLQAGAGGAELKPSRRIEAFANFTLVAAVSALVAAILISHRWFLR